MLPQKRLETVSDGEEMVNPFIDSPLFAETSDIGKLFVETDASQYLKDSYIPTLLDENPPSLLIVGDRGSGKTTLMNYIRSAIHGTPLAKDVLPLYMSMSSYSISSGKEFASEFYAGFLTSIIGVAASSEIDLDELHQIREMHSVLSSEFVDRLEATEQLEAMARESIDRISSTFRVLVVLIDNLDKYVPDVDQDIAKYFGDYDRAFRRIMIQYSSDEGLQSSFVVASSPSSYDTLHAMLGRMKDSETISVPLSWDLGYLYELARRRLAQSSMHRPTKIGHVFDDEAIFKLYLFCQRNPRLFQILCQSAYDFAKESNSFPIDELTAKRAVSGFQRYEGPWQGQDAEFVQKYRVILTEVSRSSNSAERGKSLERLAEYIFNWIEGVSVKAKRKLTRSGEIDLFLEIERDGGIWKHLGDPILVECKNLNKPAGIGIVRSFVDSVREKRLRTGILFSTKGVSGDRTKNARKRIREAFIDGLYVLDFDMSDLERIHSPGDFENMLRDKRLSLHMDL